MLRTVGVTVPRNVYTKWSDGGGKGALAKIDMYTVILPKLNIYPIIRPVNHQVGRKAHMELEGNARPCEQRTEPPFFSMECYSLRLADPINYTILMQNISQSHLLPLTPGIGINMFDWGYI